jgi:tripeptide aminopeptidase
MVSETTVEDLAADAAARLIRYAAIDTQSDARSDRYPSTENQLVLLRLLRDELHELGLRDVALDEKGYVTATLPATVGIPLPTIAYFAHVDTSPEVTGSGVMPRRIRYRGGDIVLGDSGQIIRIADTPELERHVGHELITSDGTTLLGADDKAGIAEIMAAVRYLMAHPEIPHGEVKLAFNPDEEIARGVIHFPVAAFGADVAYTVDGTSPGEISAETFSGIQVIISVRGRSAHPGYAESQLVNAIKLGCAIIDRLPKDRLSPETTSGRDGFIHPIRIEGDAANLELRFLVRDFDDDLLNDHVSLLKAIANSVAADELRATVDVESWVEYRNPSGAVGDRPEIIENLEKAVRRVGLEVTHTSLRGGTDGSALTAMGLPTPNIFTGCHNAHSEREWICVEDMGLAAATLIELAEVWSEYGAYEPSSFEPSSFNSPQATSDRT